MAVPLILAGAWCAGLAATLTLTCAAIGCAVLWGLP